MTRRDLIALAAASPLAPMAQAAPSPTAPVAIAKVASYQDDLAATMSTMFDQLGGLAKIVKNKTVTIKLNLTGSPSIRLQGKPLGVTHYTHPRTVMAMVHLLDQAGAQRIRLAESCWGTGGPLEEYLLDSGWNVRQLKGLSAKLVFENTNALGTGKKYHRLPSAGGGYIYPGFDFNHAYSETDVLMSMAKLKNHATCGVTLAMKNCFGNTPASIYGDDAGIDQPNESPTKGRGDVCHFGKRQPSKCSPAELDPSTERSAFYRMPRITVDVVSSRPLDLALIDGIETVTHGEGPWVGKLQHVKPGVLILGTNMVTTDTVGTAVMGYDPRAPKGRPPFTKCDNTLLLAEARGLGTADLKQIEVRGVPIAEAKFPFPADPFAHL
jgi:uncharacterized protein (DUF362 family)